MSLILVKIAHGSVDEPGRVLLLSKYLARIMAKDDCSAVVHSLLDGGAIVRDYYVVGERPFGYRIGRDRSKR